LEPAELEALPQILMKNIKAHDSREINGRSLSVSLAINSTNKVLASAGMDSSVKLWDLTTGAFLAQLLLQSPADSLVFSPHDPNALALTLPESRMMLVLELESRELRQRARRVYSQDLTGLLAFSKPETLVIGHREKVISFWNVQEEAASFEVRASHSSSPFIGLV